MMSWRQGLQELSLDMTIAYLPLRKQAGGTELLAQSRRVTKQPHKGTQFFLLSLLVSHSSMPILSTEALADHAPSAYRGTH